MDTRVKIVSAEQAARSVSGMDYAVVIAAFDVITVPLLHRLREIASGSTLLIAVINPQPSSLLSLRARAELAASLAIIEFVIMAEGSLEEALQQLSGACSVVDDRELDAQRTRELIEHIRRKNEMEAR